MYLEHTTEVTIPHGYPFQVCLELDFVVVAAEEHALQETRKHPRGSTLFGWV